MPTARPVTAENMNYAIVYLAGILAFAAVYWFVQGRKFYTGPLIEAAIDENGSIDRSSEEDGLKQKVESDRMMKGEVA